MKRKYATIIMKLPQETITVRTDFPVVFETAHDVLRGVDRDGYGSCMPTGHWHFTLRGEVEPKNPKHRFVVTRGRARRKS